jgi:hypothetical protein
MSVVGNDWEQLKRFNLAELYQRTKPPVVNKAEASPGKVTTGEAPADAAPLSASADSLVA